MALLSGHGPQVDAHPFKKWYESHYGVTIGVKKGKKAPPKEEEVGLPCSCRRLRSSNIFEYILIVSYGGYFVGEVFQG